MHAECHMSEKGLERALESLGIRLKQNAAGPYELVVCGGTALILSGAIPRTTKDVDVAALIKDDFLVSPDPLPDDLVTAVKEVARDLGLPEDWLNNEPSREPGGLFQFGLPEGLKDRLVSFAFGKELIVHVISRYDQIHFKLYAAVDRGGYHVEDLIALNPTTEELVAAGNWAITHDPSKGFIMMLKSMLEQLGYRDAARNIS